MAKRKVDTPKELICNFCGKSASEVEKLIAGTKVNICNECIDLCNDILKVKQYLVVHCTAQDEPSIAGYFTGDEIRKRVKHGSFNMLEIIIIDGKVIKSASNKTFDLTRL